MNIHDDIELGKYTSDAEEIIDVDKHAYALIHFTS